MRVTSKGQVTIPKKVRETLGIGPKSEVDFVEEDGRGLSGKEVKRKILMRVCWGLLRSK